MIGALTEYARVEWRSWFEREPDEIRRILKSTGFDEIAWVDLTRYSSEWFRQMLVARTDDSPPPIGFSVFVGESTPQKAKNLIRNLEEDRIAVVQAVYRA